MFVLHHATVEQLHDHIATAQRRLERGRAQASAMELPEVFQLWVDQLGAVVADLTELAAIAEGTVRLARLCEHYGCRATTPYAPGHTFYCPDHLGDVLGDDEPADSMPPPSEQDRLEDTIVFGADSGVLL